MGLIPGSERSPEEGNGNTLQYSCLEKPTDRGGWQAAVLGVTRGEHSLATTPPPQINGEKTKTNLKDICSMEKLFAKYMTKSKYL